MTDPLGLDLRLVVTSAVREVVGEMVATSVREALTTPQTPGAGAQAEYPPVTQGGYRAPAPDALPAAALPPRAELAPGEVRVDRVTIANDADLDSFARHLLTLFENPKRRQDLRTGRLRFRLAPSSQASAVGPAARVRRVERGAVTERDIAAAAQAGESVVLGPRAVLTPLGRERARNLGVAIEKERR